MCDAAAAPNSSASLDAAMISLSTGQRQSDTKGSTRQIRTFAVGGMLFCAVVVHLQAGTITVTNTNDSGPGSLRQALANANDGDAINFAVTGTIALTSGELLVAKSVTISGPGTAILNVDEFVLS